MNTKKLSKPADHYYKPLTDAQRRKLIEQRYLLAKGRALLNARKEAAA